MRQVNRFRPLTDERHGNKILNNEQHLFTLKEKGKMVEKKLRKALEDGCDCVFCYVETQEMDENLN